MDYVDISLKLAAPIAGLIGLVAGLYVYRSQKMWERKVALTGEMLDYIYSLRQNFKNYRTPWQYPGEDYPQNPEEKEFIDQFPEDSRRNKLVDRRRHNELYDSVIRPAQNLIPKVMSAFGPGSEVPLKSCLVLAKDIVNSKNEKKNIEEELRGETLNRKSLIREIRYYTDTYTWTEDDPVEVFIKDLEVRVVKKMGRYISHNKFQYPDYYSNYILIGHYKEGENHFYPVRQIIASRSGWRKFLGKIRQE